MNYYTLLDETKQYVTSYFSSHANDKLVYHNQSHTEQVVTSAIEIANHYRLSDKDYFIVVAAAWFHDLGYYTDPAHHEERGADEASYYFKRKGVDEETVQVIAGCIRATRMPQTPDTSLEKIVADADLFHLGTSAFIERNKLMRKEFVALNNIGISKDEWRHKTIHLLETHQYHTDYCRLLLTDQKEKNLEKLKAKETIKNPSNKYLIPVGGISEPVRSKEKQLLSDDDEKAKKKNRPERGIETMFRISSANHQRLSDMADSKAHIMISVNSIILSVLLSVLLKNLEQYPQFTIPAMMLLSVSLTTIVFSILATRPNIPPGTFTQNDINQKKVNLLFFGNFFRMSLDDYTSGMLQMMDDRDYLYRSLIKDVYSQGVVLGSKYRRLRISYSVFMYGLVASSLAFAFAAIITL